MLDLMQDFYAFTGGCRATAQDGLHPPLDYAGFGVTRVPASWLNVSVPPSRVVLGNASISRQAWVLSSTVECTGVLLGHFAYLVFLLVLMRKDG